MQADLIHSVVQPIAFVGDCSFSMDNPTKSGLNPPIDDLNTALNQFCKDVEGVEHSEVQLMHIRFASEAEILQGFKPVGDEAAPLYTTFGKSTDYGVGLGLAMAELEEHRAVLRASGFEVNQPWIVFVSDGKANTNTNPGFAAELSNRIESGKLLLIPVAVGGDGALEAMSKLSPKLAPIAVDSEEATSMNFQEFFAWLSDSVQAGSLRLNDLGDNPNADGDA